MMLKFLPRSSPDSLEDKSWTLIGLAFAFLILMPAVWIFGIAKNYSLIFWLITLLIFILLSLLIRKWSADSYYAVDADGIIISLPFRGIGKTRIAFNEISEIHPIDSREAKEELSRIYNKTFDNVFAERHPVVHFLPPVVRDMFFNPITDKAVGDFIRYASGNIYFKNPERKFGLGGGAELPRITAEGEFVLIALKNGKKHALSSQENEKFIAAVKNKWRPEPS